MTAHKKEIVRCHVAMVANSSQSIMISFSHWRPKPIHYPYCYMLLSDKEVTMDAIIAMSSTDVFGIVLLILFILPVICMFALGLVELFRGS